jgi:hypothetical protein
MSGLWKFTSINPTFTPLLERAMAKFTKTLVLPPPLTAHNQKLVFDWWHGFLKILNLRSFVSVLFRCPVSAILCNTHKTPPAFIKKC